MQRALPDSSWRVSSCGRSVRPPSEATLPDHQTPAASLPAPAARHAALPPAMSCNEDMSWRAASQLVALVVACGRRFRGERQAVQLGDGGAPDPGSRSAVRARGWLSRARRLPALAVRHGPGMGARRAMAAVVGLLFGSLEGITTWKNRRTSQLFLPGPVRAAPPGPRRRARPAPASP